MSEKFSQQSSQSNEEPGLPEENSVFDFLYYDATRISSFLGQFEPSGSLTQITKTERAHKGTKQSNSAQGTGSLSLLKGSLTDTTDVSREYGQQNNSVYDARWANALSFLDYISQRSLLNRDIHDARIGDLVLYSGDLSIIDLGMLQKFWNLPSVKSAMLSSVSNELDANSISQLPRSERRRIEKTSKTSKSLKAPSEAELGLDLLPLLPHSIQASVSDEEMSVWCTLRDESVTTNPSDLFMKHGMSIDGSWNIVGILDALPDNDIQLSSGIQSSTAKQMIAGTNLGQMALMIGPALATAIRQMMGRPAGSYGVTPLLLFREVSSRNYN